MLDEDMRRWVAEYGSGHYPRLRLYAAAAVPGAGG